MVDQKKIEEETNRDVDSSRYRKRQNRLRFAWIEGDDDKRQQCDDANEDQKEAKVAKYQPEAGDFFFGFLHHFLFPLAFSLDEIQDLLLIFRGGDDEQRIARLEFDFAIRNQ